MGEPFEFGTLAGEDDERAFRRALSLSFGQKPEELPAWLEIAGRDNLRVVRKDGVVAGGLIVVPMGQFFGGRSIPMAGIAGVAVAPEHRGLGAASAMMRAAMRELRGSGFCLSALYASTFPLYRGAGYEHAGLLCEATAPIKELAAFGRGRSGGGGTGRELRELPMRAVCDSDRGAIEAIYRDRARRSPGFLDRGSYVWHKVHSPRKETAHGFVVEADGSVEGYVYYAQRDRSPWLDVFVTDWCAATPRAAARLLRFLADQFAMGARLIWRTAPGDPILLTLQDRGFEVRVVEPWMLRILDVAGALTGRGYSRHTEGDLHLALEDQVVTENDGRFVVEVRGGTAAVRRGGRGSLRMDIGALGPLFSGHAAAEDLALIGRVDGPPDELAAATALFAGPAPAMVDFF